MTKRKHVKIEFTEKPQNLGCCKVDPLAHGPGPGQDGCQFSVPNMELVSGDISVSLSSIINLCLIHI